MRDYSKIDKYLTDLIKDVYPQSLDETHTNQTKTVFFSFISNLIQEGKVKTVLDAGCGQGNAFSIFNKSGVEIIGIGIGNDNKEAKKNFPDFDVREMDMHFLEFPDEHFDMVFARHILEHSPMPLLALMEWHRVTRPEGYLVVVVPHHENVVQGGINHYYMLSPVQWKVLFRRSRWKLINEDYTDITEFRFLLERIDTVYDIYNHPVI